MTLDITLPGLPGGAATLLRWLVGEGEAVAAGAPLAIVLTERAELLLPAPVAGTLAESVAVGSVVEPGGVLGRLELQEGAGSREQGAGGEAAVGVASRRRLLATPLARAIARDQGVDLAGIAGSGGGGRVLARDVRAQLPPPHSHLPTPTSPLPLATATVEFDASAALALVAAHGAAFARLGLPLGLTARVTEAVAALLPAHPLLNAAWGEGVIVLRRRVHLAVAEPSSEGLRWALVRDAGDLTLRGVARALSRCAEPTGSTFAVVSMAAGASWQSAAPPLAGAAAALSVGAPAARPVALGEALAVRPVAALTLSYDARVLDHGAAAAFLTALRRTLERAQ
jgi:pyruvate dehydrogenase E2 component (dihydrolipoamide acetyltransferase)